MGKIPGPGNPRNCLVVAHVKCDNCYDSGNIQGYTCNYYEPESKADGKLRWKKSKRDVKDPWGSAELQPTANCAHTTGHCVVPLKYSVKNGVAACAQGTGKACPSTPLTASSQFSCGNSLKYTCNSCHYLAINGYRLFSTYKASNNYELTCPNANSEWTPTDAYIQTLKPAAQQAVSCLLGNCTVPLTKMANGAVAYKTGDTINGVKMTGDKCSATYTVTCDKCYTGGGDIKCTLNGWANVATGALDPLWSTVQCVPKACPTLDTKGKTVKWEYGLKTPDGKAGCGSKATSTCSSCYETVHGAATSTFTTCSAGATASAALVWSPAPASGGVAKCQKVKDWCAKGVPLSLDHGAVTSRITGTHGVCEDDVTYGCDRCYSLSSNAATRKQIVDNKYDRVCSEQKGGTWSGLPVQCLAQTCVVENLPQIKNGRWKCSQKIVTSGYYCDAYCWLECDASFFPSSRSKRTCVFHPETRSSSWSDADNDVGCISCFSPFERRNNLVKSCAAPLCPTCIDSIKKKCNANPILTQLATQQNIWNNKAPDLLEAVCGSKYEFGNAKPDNQVCITKNGVKPSGMPGCVDSGHQECPKMCTGPVSAAAPKGLPIHCGGCNIQSPEAVTFCNSTGRCVCQTDANGYSKYYGTGCETLIEAPSFTATITSTSGTRRGAATQITPGQIPAVMVTLPAKTPAGYGLKFQIQTKTAASCPSMPNAAQTAFSWTSPPTQYYLNSAVANISVNPPAGYAAGCYDVIVTGTDATNRGGNGRGSNHTVTLSMIVPATIKPVPSPAPAPAPVTPTPAPTSPSTQLVTLTITGELPGACSIKDAVLQPALQTSWVTFLGLEKDVLTASVLVKLDRSECAASYSSGAVRRASPLVPKAPKKNVVKFTVTIPNLPKADADKAVSTLEKMQADDAVGGALRSRFIAILHDSGTSDAAKAQLGALKSITVTKITRSDVSGSGGGDSASAASSGMSGGAIAGG